MKPDLLKNLNSKQKKAVVKNQGPMLVFSGAGSGKTRVLTYKAAYLIIFENINPESILLLTFTNKAAQEMKERIFKLLTTYNLQFTNNLPFAGTFHAFCVKILRAHGNKIGIDKDFVIYDRKDSLQAVAEAMSNINKESTRKSKRQILKLISQAKNELILPTEYPRYAKGYLQEKASKVYLEYQKILSRNNALDFDDLLLKTVFLLKNRDSVAKFYQQKLKYILIDEYQDTNHAQYELTKILSYGTKNICAVGDASQSIYGFRGADFRNILKFKKTYPKCKVINLERNYRSTQIILDAAHAVISKVNTHPVLSLWTQKNPGEKISIYCADNEKEESELITYAIRDKVTQKYDFSQVAVLYRTNAQSRIVEETFLKANIPYQLIGGVRFYERKEIKDVLSYLRLITHPDDSVSKTRALKLGKQRFALFTKVREKIISNLNNLTTTEIVDLILKKTGYLDIYNPKEEKDLQRLENISELQSVAAEFPKLLEFIENVSLVENESSSLLKQSHYFLDRKKNVNKRGVSLMTLHSAKGLEFSMVFIIGMEEGLFPHSKTLNSQYLLEEERRLCYVGITRAKNKLYLSRAKKRLYFGKRVSNKVSRFIEEIPDHLADKSFGFLK